MEEASNRPHQRTTSEQLEYYVSFLRNHPEIQSNKNDPTNPQRMNILWAQLADALNSMHGPTRSSKKWKETLGQWKHQLRSRARKAKVHGLATGGGPPLKAKMKEFEERALEAFGTIAIDGLAGIKTLGIQSTKNNAPSLPSHDIENETDDDVLHSMEFLEESMPSQSFAAIEEQSDYFEESLQNILPPSQSTLVIKESDVEKKIKNLGSTKMLMNQILHMMKAREERDIKIQKENQDTQEKMAEALGTLGAGIKSLADSIALLANKP